jgi:hypothetical protein
MKPPIDPKLLDFATEGQAEQYKLYMEHQSYTKVGEILGNDPAVIRRAILRLVAGAARQGYSPDHDMTHEAAPGFQVKGVSTLYNGDGDITAQWVKTDKSKEESLELIKDAVEAICAPCKGVVEAIKAPKRLNSDLLVTYPIPDLHKGMLSWGLETGADYDTDIATDLARKAQGRLVSAAPNASTALIANLGDFFHTDNESNQTNASGHKLEVDGRWSKIFYSGVLLVRDLIIMALNKHDKVVVRFAKGNHDEHTSVGLAVALIMAFENNPRVDIELPLNPFQYYVFGGVLLGMVHNCKPNDLEGIMANDMREEWGKAKFCHWLTAHIHNKTAHEFKGCTAESFRTIAAKDAWTNRSGYRSGRDMTAIVYHKEWGEVERFRVGIESII